MPSAHDKFSPVGFDTRFIAVVRYVLAGSIPLALVFDPIARPHVVGASYVVLVLYAAYSVVLYSATRWWRTTLPVTIEHWLDVGWAVALTLLSSDPRGPFAGFLFFAILVTAFQWGLTPGFRLARIVALQVLSLGMALGYSEADAGSRYGLMGAAAMGMWGYLAVNFSKQRLRYKRCLTLLQDVSRPSSPRLGIEPTLGMLAERLRAFYDADACLLITSAPCRPGYQWQRAERRNPDSAARAENLPAELTRLLLAWPDRHAVVFSERHWLRQCCHRMVAAEVIDIERGTLAVDERRSPAVAAMLEARAFISLPLPAPELHGRLFITTRRRGTFTSADVEFLQQVFEHLRPMLQNISLTDQLASDAAEAERRRIALDVHDGIIQPYIGLQMGLEAVLRKLRRGATDVMHDLDHLLHLTQDELVQLRHMVQGLKGGGEGFNGLVPAIRRLGLKFTAATGIRVHLEVHGQLSLNECLEAEVFHIVAEGLSNIRRHTQATMASIALALENNHLRIHIRNDGAHDEIFRPFTPRSITERTMALGGEVRIERQSPAQTAVIAEIPL